MIHSWFYRTQSVITDGIGSTKDLPDNHTLENEQIAVMSIFLSYRMLINCIQQYVVPYSTPISYGFNGKSTVSIVMLIKEKNQHSCYII